MKKIYNPILLPAQLAKLCLFFALLFLYSKFGPALPINITTQLKGEPFIVEGTGKVAVTPDVAKINLGIQESGSSLKTVQDSVNKKSKTLTDSLKKLGIDERDIKTTSYNVYPQYDYTNPGQRITGYQVSINYEVKISDFDKVNKVLVSATSVGANVIGGVSFEINDKTKKEKLQEARELAVKEAKEKAEGLTEASGITLGKIINISENQGVDYPRPVPLLEKSQPDIQPGKTELSVIISLSYEIR